MNRALAFPWPVVHMALAGDGFVSSAAEAQELRRPPHRMPRRPSKGGQPRAGCCLSVVSWRPFVTYQLIKPVKTNMNRSLAFPWPVVHMALAGDGFVSSAAESTRTSKASSSNAQTCDAQICVALWLGRQSKYRLKSWAMVARSVFKKAMCQQPCKLQRIGFRQLCVPNSIWGVASERDMRLPTQKAAHPFGADATVRLKQIQIYVYAHHRRGFFQGVPNMQKST